MNKHTKIAIFVAPILILGGYILSDMYIENKADENRIFELVPYGHCDVLNQKCILKSGEFEVNVFDKDGVTRINTTFPLDTATLFLVDEKNNPTTYQLGMIDSPYYWQRETSLRSLIPEKGQRYKLRLIANIKGGQYISEFYTQTTR